MKVLLVAGVGALFRPCSVSAQDAPAQWLERLERVMPAADGFRDRQGRPPVFEAYRAGPAPDERTLIGYAFLTSDLLPEQNGFSGPIEVLVGMDLLGVLTGVEVIAYTESHMATRGDFLAAPGVQAQFAGKSILDAFRVRRDVDGITGATISVDAMSRGIRNAARSVAVAYGIGALAEASEARPLDPVSVTAAALEPLSWTQMVLRGLSQQISVLDDGRTVADVTLTYVRNDAIAEVLMGPGMLNEVLERAGPVARERHLVVAGVDGSAAGALNLARLSIVQDADTVGLESSDVLLFGPPREGKLDGEFRMARVLLFDLAADVTRSLTFVLDLRPGLGVFTAEYPGELPVAVSGRAGEASPFGRWSALLTVFGLGVALALVCAGAVFLAKRSR